MPTPRSPAIELDVGPRPVRLSNPDRVYFPAHGWTKLDLATYYLAVGDGIVRALRERPCMLHRFPEGLAGEKVHQKRIPHGAPPVSYTHLDVYKRQEWASAVPYVSDVLVAGKATKIKATWSLMWDEQALYLIADVADPNLMPADQSSPDQQWRGDSAVSYTHLDVYKRQSTTCSPTCRATTTPRSPPGSARSATVTGCTTSPAPTRASSPRPGPRSSTTRCPTRSPTAPAARSSRRPSRTPWPIARPCGRQSALRSSPEPTPARTVPCPIQSPARSSLARFVTGRDSLGTYLSVGRTPL